MNVPAWINRETIQMCLTVVVTFAVHYYFITNRISNYEVEETLDDATADVDSVVIEQNTQA